MDIKLSCIMFCIPHHSLVIHSYMHFRNCRRFFEGYRIASLLQKLLAVEGLQAQTPFLALNLQSTLLNLTQ